jgi:alpha-tubulin suppressor-like RCC1 family protein
MPFSINDACITDVYATQNDFIDRFIGTELWSWGSPPAARNDNIQYSSPVQAISGGTDWISADTNSNNKAAIKYDGTLWVWGNNNNGQLGRNTLVNASSPVQTVSGGTDWRNVSLGTTHSSAIKTNGTLWTWGYNANGQLGRNNILAASSPVQTVAGGTNWCFVSAGQFITAAIKIDGTLWLWGRNTQSNLGTNDLISRSSPVQTVAGGTNWRTVSVAGVTGASTAIKTDGTLWVWGYNGQGSLGTNNTVRYSSPVQTVAGGTNWRSVSTGSFISSAIKTDGTLWVWGDNAAGQLGNNTIINSSSPIQTISGGTNWKSACSQGNSIGAIKTDGTLWMWGCNGAGQLGTNNIITSSSPVQTVAGGTNWKSVSINSSTIALRITE